MKVGQLKAEYRQQKLISSISKSRLINYKETNEKV